AELFDEESSRGERLVADHGRGEPEARPSWLQTVFRIALAEGRRHLRRLTIDRRRQDRAVHRLDIPTGAEEFGREPVEELRMDRPLDLGAEVLDRLHEPHAEELLPAPV